MRTDEGADGQTWRDNSRISQFANAPKMVMIAVAFAVSNAAFSITGFDEHPLCSADRIIT
jgi:hypothetical protein